jgi:hypothetical protein
MRPHVAKAIRTAPAASNTEKNCWPESFNRLESTASENATRPTPKVNTIRLEKTDRSM